MEKLTELQSEWCSNDPVEAVSEGWIFDDEIAQDCDSVLSCDLNGLTYWIQQIFNRETREYEYLTVAGQGSCLGSFADCVKFLNNSF